MSSEIIIEPLSAKAFAPFGDLIELADKPTMLINQGLCGRHHDLADLNFSDGTAGISLFDGTAYSLPLSLSLVERHPLGSQAFLPMTSDPFLVIVAADAMLVDQRPTGRQLSSQYMARRSNTPESPSHVRCSGSYRRRQQPGRTPLW
jgi:ureidoglycolate lyase